MLSMPSGQHGFATLSVRSVGREDRWPRAYKPALQLFAIGWLLVPVPLLHVAGPLLLWGFAAALLVRRLGQTSRVLAVTLACPKCTGDVEVAEQGERWPILTACNACRWQVQLTPHVRSSESGAPTHLV